MWEDPVPSPLVGLVEVGLKKCPESTVDPVVMDHGEPVLLCHAPPEPLDLRRIGLGQVLEQHTRLQTHNSVHTEHCALGL